MRKAEIQTCYVSIPFGIKQDPNGRSIDFDRLYHEAIKPAVIGLGIECVRLDEAVAPGGSIQRALFSLVLGSDLMIAEVSTPNANVLYELGLRHLARRSRTIVLMAQGAVLPANISSVHALVYAVESDGALNGPGYVALRDALAGAIQRSQDLFISDSPVYEFFPDLAVDLPPELGIGQRRLYPRNRRPGSGLASKEQSARQVRAAADEFRASPNADPFAYLDLLRAARDASNWRQLVELADDAPQEVRRAPEVCQLLALALNRLGERERATSVILELIADTGGDGESYGILGRIYKDQYEDALRDGDEAKARERLLLATAAYRAGFEKNPDDYYPGVNVVTLLRHQKDPAAAAELQSLLPRVRAAVERNIQKSPQGGFWLYATQMQLAAIAGDWQQAERAAKQALEQTPAPWMIESTQRELASLERASPDEASQEAWHRLQELLSEGHRREAEAGLA